MNIDYWTSGKTLKQGDQGTHIAELQRDLLKLGANPGAIDGDFGAATAGAVKLIEKNWKYLFQTGTVNAELAKRIRRNAEAIKARNPREPQKLEIIPDFTKHNFSQRIPGFPVYMLVLHYTAMYGGLNNPAPSVGVFKSPSSQVSAHYVIGYDGKIRQVVDEKFKAWHCGPSVHKGKYDCNPVSIGIEIENFGPLVQRGESFYHSAGGNYLYTPEHEREFGKPMRITQDGYFYWMPYSVKQIEAVKLLSADICKRYSIKESDVVGHRDVSGPPVKGTKGYTGKMDPGPAFPMKGLKDYIYRGIV